MDFECLEAAVTRVRKCTSTEIINALADGAWKAAIEKDYEKRSGKNHGRRAK